VLPWLKFCMYKEHFVNFDSFNFNPQIKAGITAAGYTDPTPIQAQAIPPVMQGRDLLGLAQTGTGKTAAFILPILERLLPGRRGALRALILSPTRELAEQTHQSARLLGRQTGLRSLTIYGGVKAGPQIKGLHAGVDIVVACPGRLLDLMGQRHVDLSQVEVVVLDEADRMFDMGFLPDVRRIFAALPAARQTLLFSATMPAEIRGLTAEILRRPVTVEIGDSRPVETVSHAVYPALPDSKSEMLVELLSQADGQVLVFTRTKRRTEKLARQLSKAGLSATSLQGDLSQGQRQASMDGFRSGRVKIMVATDIAARGIDVLGISHVINYDLPDTADAYTHRIGRTGRMTRTGQALSLVTQDDLPMMRTIERLLGQSIERRQLPGFESNLLERPPEPPRRVYTSPYRKPRRPRPSGLRAIKPSPVAG
jgi:ATP-dependent RNA helicase RhlE